jgi:hypothetical protein
VKKGIHFRIFYVAAVFAVLSLAGGIQVATAADSISGLWKEVSTPKHENSYVVFSQDAGLLFVTCYWEFEGTPIVWHGVGSAWGNQVEYAYKSTKIRSGWDPVGKQEMTLSPDGKTLTGTWKNTRGESGPLKFIKIK